jgi:hypothetical protein
MNLLGVDPLLLKAVEKELVAVSTERAFPLSEKLSESGETFSGFCQFFLVNYRKFSLSKILNSLLNSCIHKEIEI